VYLQADTTKKITEKAFFLIFSAFSVILLEDRQDFSRYLSAIAKKT
jgi:hypothetical protein